MFGSEILEVAIGLILVYLLLALICSALSEYIAQLVALRSGTLEKGVRNFLDDPKGIRLAGKIYDHSLVKALYKKGFLHRKGRPSNIPARTFALALFDTVMAAGEPLSIKVDEDVMDDKGRSKALH